MANQKQRQNRQEQADDEQTRIGVREDGTSFTNTENEWPEGTPGPHGHPARESERGRGELPAED